MRQRIVSALPLVVIAALTTGCQTIYDLVGGNFVGDPYEMEARLSPEAHRLIDSAFVDIDSRRMVDFHVHLVGTGSSTGIELHSSWFHSWNPLVRGRTGVYMSAAGVKRVETADNDYVRRLVALLRTMPGGGRCILYAMDRHHDDAGHVVPDRTPYFVPNHVVASRVAEHPDLFVPAVSIHPYRPDAIEELQRWAARGVRFVKWIPNAMGIDPSSPKIDAFYEVMKSHGMVLLSHTGHELTFDSEQSQHLGNPLLLRRPLDIGVTVIALHCATDGVDTDLDDPDRAEITSFELFLRLMDESRYEGRLYGELSAATFAHRASPTLSKLLERDDLHPRLVNGSDYPLVGINVLIRTSELVDAGHITEDEAGWLNEVYGYNPLLFDFLVKRTIRHPVTGKRFPASVFMVPDGLRAFFEPAGSPRSAGSGQ